MLSGMGSTFAFPWVVLLLILRLRKVKSGISEKVIAGKKKKRERKKIKKGPLLFVLFCAE